MKLSEAILLGDTLKKPDPGEWISEDGSCGCALGGALLAAGVKPEEFTAQWGCTRLVADMPIIKIRWPWLEERHVARISRLYGNVVDGSITIEALADYVRSIEPAEPSITILPSRQPLVRIPEGSDQGDEQPGWDDTDTSRELYSGIQRGCQ